MDQFLRRLFFLLIVWPVTQIVLGLNVRHRDRLPRSGPALVVANHNSHLDTMVLMTLFPFRLFPKIRPVAAMDYFLRNRALAWLSLSILGIIPLQRSGFSFHEDPLSECSRALERGDILILFPEGSRGEAERLSNFKTGIAHLAKRHPEVPVIPVFLHGLGKALPKGEAVLVPFFCDVFVGEPQYWTGDRRSFMNCLEHAMKTLADEGHFPPWE